MDSNQLHASKLRNFVTFVTRNQLQYFQVTLKFDSLQFCFATCNKGNLSHKYHLEPSFTHLHYMYCNLPVSVYIYRI